MIYFNDLYCIIRKGGLLHKPCYIPSLVTRVTMLYHLVDSKFPKTCIHQIRSISRAGAWWSQDGDGIQTVYSKQTTSYLYKQKCHITRLYHSISIPHPDLVQSSSSSSSSSPPIHLHSLYFLKVMQPYDVLQSHHMSRTLSCPWRLLDPMK